MYLVHLDNLEPLFKPVIQVQVSAIIVCILHFVQEHFLGREAVTIELIHRNTATGGWVVWYLT